MFQSLFWWILYCDKNADNTIANAYRFQSLFWWILYCDSYNADYSFLAFQSFNPCFGGSYIVTLPQLNASDTKPGFNPCFGGSYIVTHPGENKELWNFGFQSLFWWILYCDQVKSWWFNESYSVSILVLVDLILWPSRLVTDDGRLPVSILVLVDLILWLNWICKRERRIWVSILVLVDLILWLKFDWSNWIRNIVSILVLVDLILWRYGLYNYISICIGFNPCFGGSYIVTS